MLNVLETTQPFNVAVIVKKLFPMLNVTGIVFSPVANAVGG